MGLNHRRQLLGGGGPRLGQQQLLLGLGIGLQQQGLLLGLGIEHQGLGPAPGCIHLGFPLPLGAQHRRPLLPLGGHLLLHRLLHPPGGFDVTQLHPRHLHAPGIGGQIELLEQHVIHLGAGGEGFIEVELAHLGADLGEHQVHHRRLQVVHRVIGAGMFEQLPVHHRIHLNRHVVAGDALLRWDVEHPLLE